MAEVGLPSLAGQPPGGGLTTPPPTGQLRGPLGLHKAEAEVPPHLMCPCLIYVTTMCE